MRIVIATPLYPPEIAEPAPYTKELAKRLSATHEVTVVAYGRLLEPVPGVTIVEVNKRHPLLVRLVTYFFALLHMAKSADIVYAQNGPSVELPVGLVSRIDGHPLFLFGITDHAAHTRARENLVQGFLHRFARRRAHGVITATPPPRPEILPLEPYPTEAMQAYEASWVDHLELLEKTFRYGR